MTLNGSILYYLVLLWLMCSQIGAFPVKYPQFSATIRPHQVCRTSRLCVAASSIEERAARFHSDMERVLEMRKRLHNGATSPTVERRQRPPILSEDIDGAERILKMLQHMVDLGVATETSFQIAMKAILGRGRLRWKNDEGDVICAADQLPMLLQQLQALDPPSLSVETYNFVLEGYAVCATPRGERNYAKRAHALLEHMMEEDAFDVHSIKHVVHAWAWQQANLQPGTCAQKAQDLLELIEEESDDPEILLQCYDWVLEAWSKSSSEGSAERALRMLEQMKDLNDASITLGLPNAESYSNAILAWSKCNMEESTQNAQELLEEMIDNYKAENFPPDSEPPLIAFNAVITAWARLGSLKKAEQVLWEMENLRKHCSTLVPDVQTYNSVLHAHVKSKHASLEKTLELVHYMEDHCEEQPAICPDGFTYNTLSKAWIQSGEPDAAEQAERLLLKMERSPTIHLTTRNFNIVLNAYAKSKSRVADSKAHALLQRMEESRDVQPDIISYTSVMECFSKSSDANASEQALQLLDTAFERYQATNSTALRPNLRTFTMAILALAQCPRPGNAEKAYELLQQLVGMYNATRDDSLRPNEYPYNYVLNCAANTLGTSKEKLQAFSIATKVYQEMRRSPYLKADSFTHAFWIKACNNLLPACDLYEKCMSLSFEQCRKDGLVTNEVLNRLQQGHSKTLVRNILGEYKRGRNPVQVQHVPPDWSRNTVKRRNKR